MRMTITIPIIIILSFFLSLSAQQQQQQLLLLPSQSKTLLRLQRLLEYPSTLSSWSSPSSVSLSCNLPTTTTTTLSLTCTNGHVTTLSITGTSTPLSSNFSTDSLFATLAFLPSLTSLSLRSLALYGPLSPKAHRLALLQTLDLSSNLLSGPLPPQLSTMSSLQTLILANNTFSSKMPPLAPLSALKVLDLQGNRLGPDLPELPTNVETLILRGNTFRGAIPTSMAKLLRVKKLDLAENGLGGLIPAFVFSFPTLQFLSLAGNRFSGQVAANVSCGAKLAFVDVSGNRLVGSLPKCLVGNFAGRVVVSDGNCLSSGDLRKQKASGYCNDAAIAAVLPPANKISGSKSDLGLILGVVGGVVAGVVLLGLVAFLVFRRRGEEVEGGMLRKAATEKPVVVVAPRATPADARHLAQAVRIGTLGMPAYRVFGVEELEEATECFGAANLVEDGPRGQYYKGRLQDGTMVMVRGLKLKQKFSSQSLLQYIELIAKLRHRHLVSMLGHCLVSRQDGVNTTTTIYLVTEYVSNGTLRSHLVEWRKREMLKWPQRVSALIGVARGVQLLHTVTLPGIVRNDLNIENVLLDQTLSAKVSHYNLPVLPKTKNNKVGGESPFVAVEDGDLGSWEDGEKEDIYQLGLILLEIITGKPPGSKSELEFLRSQLQKSLTDGEANLKGMTDTTIRGTFALDSLKTAVELALNCTSMNPSDRPSIDDVLWNLQYSGQVQDGWASSENLSIQS